MESVSLPKSPASMRTFPLNRSLFFLFLNIYNILLCLFAFTLPLQTLRSHPVHRMHVPHIDDLHALIRVGGHRRDAWTAMPSGRTSFCGSHRERPTCRHLLWGWSRGCSSTRTSRCIAAPTTTPLASAATVRGYGCTAWDGSLCCRFLPITLG